MNALWREIRANPRLRAGLWMIAAILLVYLSLLLRDYQKSLEKDYYSAQERLGRMQAVSTQTEWPARVEEARSLRAQLEDKLWRADSRGYASAALQAWLDIQSKQARIANPHLKVEEAQDVAGAVPLWRVGAVLEGDFSPDALEALLRNLAMQPQWIVVERLHITPGRRPRFTFALSAYFQTIADE